MVSVEYISIVAAFRFRLRKIPLLSGLSLLQLNTADSAIQGLLRVYVNSLVLFILIASRAKFSSQLHINISSLNLAYDEASCRNSVALGKEKADAMTRFRPRVAQKHQFYHLYHHRHFKYIANPKYGRPSIPQPFNTLLGKRAGRCYYWGWQWYAFPTRSYPSTPHPSIIFQHSGSA